MKKSFVKIGLFLAILLGLFFHLYKINEVPPCLNADEVAFSYNAYSISKTGRDEYGAFMPLRFKSFEDYKLPLYTYLSVPIIKVFGLNDYTTRALNIIIGVSFIPLVFFITKELFKNEKIGLLAAFVTAINPGVYIMSRHAHEGVVGTFFVLLFFLFFVKFLKTKKPSEFLLANLFLFLNAFSYQTGRVYLAIFVLLQIGYLIMQKAKTLRTRLTLIVFLLILSGAALFADLKYGVNRVNNLFFYKNIGFQLKLNEYIGEHPVRLIHNKLTETVRDISNRYFTQISPEFLVLNGDSNLRFGFPNLGLFTPIEFVALMIGFYYLFKNKERFRFLLLFLILVAPLNNALTWQGASIIRTYVILFPLAIVIGYGSYFFYQSLNIGGYRKFVIFAIILAACFYKYLNWDIYFNHYPKRAVVVRAWQCGYKELADYVKVNYNKYDKFYVTDRQGQPYIFFLYFLRYDPATYQKQAKITAPDGYGFGQVEKFDKFEFKFAFDEKLKRSVFVGYPDQFDPKRTNMSKVKKIKIGTEEMFWIYENN